MDVRLVMFKNGQMRKFSLRNGKLRIGRAPDSDLQIPTRDVSRNHCEVLLDAGDVIIHDAGSTNGTFVNGKPVDETELSAGDRLTVGPITFVVQIDGQPEDITPRDTVDPRGRRKTEPASDKPESGAAPPPAKPVVDASGATPRKPKRADEDEELPDGLLDILDGKDDDDDELPPGLIEDDDEDDEATGELLDLSDLELDIDLGEDDDKK